jgi:hypothetical protein
LKAPGPAHRPAVHHGERQLGVELHREGALAGAERLRLAARPDGENLRTGRR